MTRSQRQSVDALVGRFDPDPDHSRQVAWLSLRLFDQLQSEHGLDRRDRDLLEAAARLHDIGWHISGKAHHKHSGYLVANSSLSGFKPDEIGLIALVARYHRKSEPKQSHGKFSRLERSQRQSVCWLAGLLRTADSLDRSHASVVLKVRVECKAKTAHLLVQVRGDGKKEIEAAHDKSGLLGKMLDRAIEISVAK